MRFWTRKRRRPWLKSFSVNLMQTFNRNSPRDIAAVETCVRQGDILIFQGGWKAPNNAVIQEIYRRCGAR